VRRVREVKGDPDAALAGLVSRLSGSGDPVYLEPGWIIGLPRPRMTVRFLIVVVALAALTTEAGMVGWRAVTYRMRAGDHVRYLRSGQSFYDSDELRHWHEQMRRKYELAASRPWLPVDSDPPPPD
jgi:hypothetical protein